MPRPFFAAQHLDSPILDIDLQRYDVLLRRMEDSGLTVAQLLSTLKKEQREDRQQETYELISLASALVKGEGYNVWRKDKSVVLEPCDYPDYFNRALLPATGVEKNLNKAESVVIPIIQSHAAWLHDRAHLKMTSFPTKIWSTLAKKYAVVEDFWGQIVDSYVEKRAAAQADPVKMKVRDHRALVTQRLVYIYEACNEGRYLVMSYEQLLMIRDVALTRRNVFLVFSLLYPSDDLLPLLAEKSFHWQELCLTRYGNQGYEVAKSVESLSKAYLTRMTDSLMAGDDDAFSLMVEKIKKKEDSMGYTRGSPDENHRYLADIYSGEVLFPAQNVHQVVELFGLQKFSGHPLIDVYTSSAKSTRLATSPDTTTPSVLLQHRRRFCDMFARSFIQKNHRWPKLIVYDQSVKLATLYYSQTLHLPRGSYSLSDWDNVRLSKEFELNMYPDFLELMDDKSISFEYRDRASTWDGSEPSTHKRLLIELLTRRNFDLGKIIARIEIDDVPKDWYIVSLYPKEREFKLEARMFSMMVLEMRTFFAMHEANLAKYILPYFPQVTMTDSRKKVHERFLDMTRPFDDDQYGRVFIELDLSSWNLLFREGSVYQIGGEINHLFGVNRVFTFVHTFFSRSLMMTRVAGARPEGIERDPPPDGPLTHWNHLGGLEGIAQKLWSICTVVQVEEALSPMRLSYTITEQGDNIVLTITYPRDIRVSARDQAYSVSTEAIERCEKAFRDINQELKPEECLISSTVVTYSKNIYISGVDYPLSGKLLSRMIPSGAIDFPSLSSDIGSIFSTAISGASSAKRPECCYWLALIISCIHMVSFSYRGHVYGDVLRHNDVFKNHSYLRKMLVRPSELGGLPIIGPYSFLYLGGGDPLSKSLASLVVLQKHLPEAREIIASALDDRLYKTRPTFRALLMDPYSLPVRSPTNPANAALDESLDVVKNITINHSIATVLSFAGDEYEESLLETLKTMVPFNPVVARDLWDSSVLGSVESMKRMFLQTRSLQAASRDEEGSSITSRLLASGRKEIEWQCYLAQEFIGSTRYIESLYTFVCDLRTRWDDAGVKITGLTSYLPIDFVTLINEPVITAGIRGQMRSEGQDVFYSRGLNRPYLGSETKEKRSEHGYKIVGEGRAVSALKTLQRILSWGDQTSDLGKLIDYLSRSRSGLGMTEYSPILAGILGGDLGHRYEARIGERGASILGQSSAAAFVTLDSDSAGFLSASKDDYPVMFQEFFLELIAILSYRWSQDPAPALFEIMIHIGHSPLTRLETDGLTVTYSKILPEVPRTMVLVQSEGINIERTGGPDWECGTPIRPPRQKSLLFAALVSELRRATRMESHTIGILEHTVKVISPKFGIPEIKGIGLITLIDACAICVIELVNGTIHSSTLTERFNSQQNLVVLRVSSLLASFVARFVRHPQLQNDPIIQECTVGAGPTYDNRFSDTRLVQGFIMRRASAMYANPRSKYYSTDEVVFGSDTGEQTLEGYVRLLRKKASQALVSGRVTEEDANFIVGSSIRRMSASNAVNERERIQVFLHMCQTYNHHRKADKLVSREAYRVALAVSESRGLSCLRGTDLSALEVVRMYRHRQQRFRNQRSVHEDVIFALSDYKVVYTDLTTRVDPVTRVDNALYQLTCSWGRPYDLASGAMDFFYPLRDIFKDKQVYVVGVGLGAAATSALIGGAREVVGHDLRVTLPTDMLVSTYVPPLVRFRGQASRYRLSETSYMTSGDWFDPQVSYDIAASVDLSWIMVIDISSQEGWSYRSLEVALINRIQCMILWKVQGDLETIANAIGYAVLVSRIHGIFRGECHYGVHEIGILLTLECTNPPVSWRPQIPSDWYVLRRQTGRRCLHFIVTWLFSPTGISIKGTIRLCAERTLETVRKFSSQVSSRPNYDEWTRILQVLIASEILLTNSREDIIEVIRQVVNSPIIYTTTLKDNSIRVTPQLVSLLTRYIPRLMNDLDTHL